MSFRTRAVSIKQVPEKLDVKRGRLFFRELESCMNVERPCIVLDCSHVLQMDRHALHLLLCCLEGAIKRNGDVRLAAVTPSARLDLQHSAIDRIFRIFDTVEDAVESFERRVTHSSPDPGKTSLSAEHPATNAA